ncbi:MAG: LTA synthase family protein [Mollicutes bacterium]|nr:LTA synthase family protein [Mollicutes bacterium]
MFIYYLSLIAPFMQSRYQFEKNIDLFRNPDNQSVAVDQFGVTMFFIIDLNSFIFPSEAPIEHIVINPPKETIVETDDSRIIDDSIWEAIIENEKNTRLKQINSYFINRRITERNEYTGLFKDKNLILIMMESISLLGINEEYFPNLYKLWNEGISFNNFYSPRNSCPTGNNEMTALVGLYTINNSCTANTYRKNIYPQALFNKFKESGYYASSYHNYVDQYYYRNDIHLNSGSQKYYNAQALKIKVINKHWPSDVELFEKGLPNFINEDRFMSLMTTVTAHAPYNVGSIYGNKNFDLFKDLNITNSLKRYYSKVYELDQGIKYLLEELERTNKLDDTVIILFGDHQPYSLGVKQQVDVLGEEAGKNKNIEKTPLIIYNSQIQGKIIDDYVSIIDLAPTILNLFDLDYDPRYYVGEDIFDPNSEKRAIFTDGSWQDEVGFFNASNDNFILNDPDNEDVGYSDEEIIEINTVINLKQKMSNLAIKSNYFYHLEQARKKYINN